MIFVEAFFCCEGNEELPKTFYGSAAAGWKELKKSAPPKSMSIFLAPSDFTCPLSYFLAKLIPPEGAASDVYNFFPSCMLPAGLAATCYATGTEIG